MEFEGLDERIDWEARRVAAAFGVETWHAVGVEVEQYIGFKGFDANNTHVEFNYWLHLKEPMLVYVGEEQTCSVWDEEDNDVELRLLGDGEALMRGLYRIGVQVEEIVAFCQLVPLTAHEKLELRLSLPREFWPKTWLDKEGEE